MVSYCLFSCGNSKWEIALASSSKKIEKKYRGKKISSQRSPIGLSALGME
jgi:hypothetical protein